HIRPRLELGVGAGASRAQEVAAVRRLEIHANRLTYRVLALHYMNDPQPEGHMASYIARRRLLATLGGAAAAWLAARAQQPRKIYRVGLLVSGAPMGATDKRRQTLLSVLAAHGFVDGQNLVFVQRSADARPERLDGLAAGLKAAKVDVIVTFGYPAALAAKESTRDIPIVISAAGDPVATGLVDWVARPGGNITGVTELSTEAQRQAPRNLKGRCAGPGARGHAVERRRSRHDAALPRRRGCGQPPRHQSPDLGRARARRFRACLRRDDARAARRHRDGVRCADHA